MNFSEFQEVMKEQIKDFLPPEYRDAEVKITESAKINQHYTGLVVRKEEQVVAPTVNLDSMFAQYEEGKSLHAILQESAKIVRIEPPLVNAAMIGSYEQVKEHLFLRVCNAEQNADLLQNVPHERMADLALTYNLSFEDGAGGLASAVITNDLLAHFGISAQQLHEDAMQSAQVLMPVKIEEMGDILAMMEAPDAAFEMSGPAAPGDLEGMLKNADVKNGMTVITNGMNMHGASALFYPEVMDRIGEVMEGNYFILPSSVHECILLADNGSMTHQELTSLVKEVNSTQVLPQEQLSDTCYHYDVQDRVFEKGADFEERMAQKALAKNAEKQAEKHPARSVLKDLGEKVAEAKAKEAPAKAAKARKSEVSL